MVVTFCLARQKSPKWQRNDGRLTRDNVLLYTHQGAHALLLDMGIFFLELVRESKRYDRQSGVIIRTGLALGPIHDFLGAFECVFPFATMDVANANVPPTSLQSFT